MSAYFDQACGLFGAASCRTANALQYVEMAMVFLVTGILAWLIVAVVRR